VTQGRADYRLAEKLGAPELTENVEMNQGREGLRDPIALVGCGSIGELGPNRWPGRLPPLADEPFDRLAACDGDTQRDCRIRSVSITADDQARSVSCSAPASSPFILIGTLYMQ
jgi:hypothetical protein